VKDAVVQGRWVAASDLRVGDMLLLVDGCQSPIEQIQVLNAEDVVYNFAVEPFHTYAVGHARVLVHNSECGEALDLTQKKINNLKQHIFNGELDAARREAAGQVVKLKASGVPWDHVDELQNAQNGLLNVIDRLQRIISKPLDVAPLLAARRQLSEASRLLDLTEEFLPR